MNFIRRNRFFEWIASLSLLWLAACAAAISPEMLKDVDQSLPFEGILKDPAAFQGKAVLLGGDIIETENFPDKTLIIILQRPLDSKQKPSGEDKSKGRFIVSAPGFLDPAIYGRGRQITVVGTVAGKVVRALDEIEYTYPIIDRRELYLWPIEETFETEPRVIFGIGIGFGF
ncbi:MAG: Slp family lipoprotein [Desulfobacteraceae bacterium]|nr:Slp family lipoprotein [Desulfobacteraceae bacterium]